MSIFTTGTQVVNALATVAIAGMSAWALFFTTLPEEIMKNLNSEIAVKDKKLIELREDVQNIEARNKEAIRLFEQRRFCQEILSSLQNISDLAYTFAATMELFNLPALAAIASKKGYLKPEEIAALQHIDHHFWYTGWKPNAARTKDLMERNITAQMLAQIVVGSINVGSYFSPFSDGTDADRDYPLSRLFILAAERSDNKLAEEFLLGHLGALKQSERKEESSLFPNVSNQSMIAVGSIKDNRANPSREAVVEFAKEAIRLRNAHVASLYVFRWHVMNDFERKCPNS